MAYILFILVFYVCSYAQVGLKDINISIPISIFGHHAPSYIYTSMNSSRCSSFETKYYKRLTKQKLSWMTKFILLANQWEIYINY